MRVVIVINTNITVKKALLQRYGFSIKLKQTRLVFTNDIDPRTDKQEILEYSVSACHFDKNVIHGSKGFVGLDALQVLAEYNINAIVLDKRGSCLVTLIRLGVMTLLSVKNSMVVLEMQ